MFTWRSVAVEDIFDDISRLSKDESHEKDRSSCAFFAVQLRLEGRNKLRKGNLTGRVPVAAACTTDQKLNERVVIKQSLAFVIH